MFHIHRQSSVPIVEQICREFTDRIQSGILEPGSRLPSVRELSARLQVSLVTAVHAYEALEKAGLVTRIHGKGTFVSNGQMDRVSPTEAQGQLDWQLSVSDYLPRAAVLRQHGHTAHSADIPFRMSTAALNPVLASMTLPDNLDGVLKQARNAVAGYGPAEGMGSLRKAISAYLGEQRIASSADDILITNGVQQAIDLVARTFIGPGDVVVVEAPTYAGAIDVFRSRGAHIISIPMDSEGIRLDLLTKQCDTKPPKLIYTMPTFQNPTGIVMSARRRAELLNLAESYSCLMMEDDSFAECTFGVKVPSPIQSNDHHGHVIYLRGFSKMFCAGCRIGALVSTGSIRNRLLAAKSVSDLGSPTLTQILMEACILQPDRQNRLAHISRAIQKKRDLVLQGLKSEAPEGVHWTSPAGGYNVWVTLPSHVNTDMLLIRALQHGVSFLPGSACYANETVLHQLRISYAYLEDDALMQGVHILCNLMAESVAGKVSGWVPVV